MLADQRPIADYYDLGIFGIQVPAGREQDIFRSQCADSLAVGLQIILGQAIEGAKSLNDGKIADYIRGHTFKTVMGDIKFGKDGEWAKARWMQVQYHDIKQGAGLETWKGMSYQTVLSPPELATGKAIYPYEKAAN